jgi:hypothetical protein
MRGVRALLLPLLFAPVAVYAEGDPEKFRVGGAVRAATVYDDNFRNNDREIDDLGYWIEPRLDAEYTRRKLRLKAELGADLRIHPQHSQDNDGFLHVVGEFDWRLGRGLTLFISDAFVPGSFELGRPSDDVGNLGQTNRAEAELRYERELPGQRGILFGVGGSRFTTEDFEASLDTDGDGLTERNPDFHSDYWEADAYLELQQRFGRKHRLYIRGEARERRFDEFRQADYSELFGLIGVRGRLGRRIRWGAALGYGQLDYERGGSDGRVLGNAKIEYPFGRGYQLDASVSRRLTSDAAFSDFRETTWRAALLKRMGSRMEVTLASFLTSFRNSVADERDNRVWGAELEVRRHLWRHVEGSLRLQHFHNGGDESADDFRKNRVLLELTYRF